MSDTPKTQMAARRIGAAAARWKSGEINAVAFADAVDRFADAVAELERENAALRADKERLDWLAVSDEWFDVPATESFTPQTFRAAIDAARKEQP